MNNWRLILIFFYLCLLSFRAYSQIGCIEPLPPVLTIVSVQPETGFTELNWIISPSSNIYAYVVYIYSIEGGSSRGDSIDIVMDPAATSYTYIDRVANYFSKSYAIGSRAQPYCRSKFSNVITTIFAEASIDSCNKKITIKWNSYTDVPKKIIDYSILFSVNGGSFTEAGRAGSDKTVFTLNDFINDEEYCFVVKANLEDGTFSTSNKSCLLTKMQRPPDWINADYATVNENNNINLSFSIDPLSVINSYRLERMTENESGFSIIDQIESKNKQIFFTDKTADPFKKNIYHLLAINNCGNPVVGSNQAGNIVPNLEYKGNDIVLSWDSYRSWLGKISDYKVYINTGKGFDKVSSISAVDTVFTLDYSSVMYDITSNNICFFLKASETDNPHGIAGETSSVQICTDIIENITVPNAFTPNNDLTNDFFKPILSFTPSEYHLVITDRKNNILFDSRDQMASWNGERNGESLPQGVYLWFLRLKTPSGKQISRTGTVTIFK
jgi:gliding motility-associated-like protein